MPVFNVHCPYCGVAGKPGIRELGAAGLAGWPTTAAPPCDGVAGRREPPEAEGRLANGSAKTAAPPSALAARDEDGLVGVTS